MKQTQVVGNAIVPGDNIPLPSAFETVAGKAKVN
jgi:hypothetical protein